MNTQDDISNTHLPYVNRGTKIGTPDTSRVVMLFFEMPEERVSRIITSVLNFSEDEVKKTLADTRKSFSGRHRNAESIFCDNYERIKKYIPEGKMLTLDQQALLGSYFTKEYSIEAAALFNPSIVPHPDQSHLPKGSQRFVMSLRATGEGHVSSIEFRTGVVDAKGHVRMDKTEKYLETATINQNTSFSAPLFKEKLLKAGVDEPVAVQLLDGLGDRFGYVALNNQLATLQAAGYFRGEKEKKAFDTIKQLQFSGYVQSGYGLSFNPDTPLSARVIFGKADREKNGAEDLRLVQFTNDNAETTYHATYTAYDGRSITPHMMTTRDFVDFEIEALSGAAATGKGMALFPRKIAGKYRMLGRQDGENLTIMESDDLHHWDSSAVLQTPKHPWDIIQTGNCGSPIETGKGWLVITHGVGPMRQYSIGAILLDLDDPSKVIGEMTKPLLTAQGMEREGYVPNALYSCGELRHTIEGELHHSLKDKLQHVNYSGIEGRKNRLRSFTEIIAEDVKESAHNAKTHLRQPLPHAKKTSEVIVLPLAASDQSWKMCVISVDELLAQMVPPHPGQTFMPSADPAETGVAGRYLRRSSSSTVGR